MGITSIPARYRINGVISTDKTVMQNLEMLCGAAQSWLTYDINQGKWAVVINKEGTSVASFDDSNIIGSISLQGTGLKDLYNAMRVEFPHVDLNDELDFVQAEIPAADRNDNEPDNTLNIQFDCINDPVMAEMLGIIELKQSRVDKVITFTTDYSYLGLKAGDLIDVTNSVLGYTNKMFRVITMNEMDGDDGGLTLGITALEYDADVYSLDDLYRYERTNENGIVTIGQIDAPTTPIITAYEQSVRPGVVIETTVPAGIVEGIEFWYSTDNTNFINIGVEVPTTGAFSYGDTVTFDYDKFDAVANVYAKCRAINSTTSSDYSSVGSLLSFTPQQVTDAIKDGSTSLLNSSGVGIPAALGIATLVGKVGTAFGSNSTAKLSDAVFTQAGFPGANSIPIFATFQTTLSPAAVDSAFDTYIGTTPIAFNSGGYAAVGNGAVLSFSLASTVQQLMIVTQCPQVDCSYQYYDDSTSSVQTRSGVYAYMPCIYQIYRSGTKIQESTADWQTQSIILLVENATPASYEIRVKPLLTYDLNQTTTKNVFFYDQTTSAQASGGGITATAFGFSVIP